MLFSIKEQFSIKIHSPVFVEILAKAYTVKMQIAQHYNYVNVIACLG